MPTLFKSLAEMLKKVEATKKRTQTVSMVADFLKALDADELEPAVSHDSRQTLPEMEPKNTGRKLGNPEHNPKTHHTG
jgi:hypothetical protein